MIIIYYFYKLVQSSSEVYKFANGLLLETFFFSLHIGNKSPIFGVQKFSTYITISLMLARTLVELLSFP